MGSQYQVPYKSFLEKVKCFGELGNEGGERECIVEKKTYHRFCVTK